VTKKDLPRSPDKRQKEGGKPPALKQSTLSFARTQTALPAVHAPSTAEPLTPLAIPDLSPQSTPSRQGKKRTRDTTIDTDRIDLPPSKMSKEEDPPAWAKQQTEALLGAMNKNQEEVLARINILSEQITAIDSRVKKLEAKDGSSTKEADRIKSDLRAHTKALVAIDDAGRKRNVLLMGIPETEKSDVELRKLAESHIGEVTGESISIDSTFRRGRWSSDRARPIVAILHSISDRDMVLNIASQYCPPGDRPSVKPDLCPATREEIHRKWEEKQKSGPRPNPQSSIPISQQGPLHHRSSIPHQSGFPSGHTRSQPPNQRTWNRTTPPRSN